MAVGRNQQGQIKDATKRQAQLAARKPELQAQIAELQSRIEREQVDSECAKQIAAMEQKIREIGYSSEQHNQVRTNLRQAQAWQLRYQQLLSAQQQYPNSRPDYKI